MKVCDFKNLKRYKFQNPETFPKRRGFYICINAWGDAVFLFWNNQARGFDTVDEHGFHEEIDDEYILYFFDMAFDKNKIFQITGNQREGEGGAE